MYMEELNRYLRQQAGEERPEDTPVSGDIAEASDLGIKVEKIG